MIFLVFQLFLGLFAQDQVRVPDFEELAIIPDTNSALEKLRTFRDAQKYFLVLFHTLSRNNSATSTLDTTELFSSSEQIALNKQTFKKRALRRYSETLEILETLEKRTLKHELD